MAVYVLCRQKKCAFISKRASRKYKYVDGSPAYTCNKPAIVIGEIWDCDGEVYELEGRNIIECKDVC